MMITIKRYQTWHLLLLKRSMVLQLRSILNTPSTGEYINSGQAVSEIRTRLFGIFNIFKLVFMAELHAASAAEEQWVLSF